MASRGGTATRHYHTLRDVRRCLRDFTARQADDA